MRRRGQPEFQVVHKRRPILRLRDPDRSDGREERRAPAARGSELQDLELRDRPAQERPVLERSVPRPYLQGRTSDRATTPPAVPVSSSVGSFFAGLQGVDVESLRREADELFADLPDAHVRQARGTPVRHYAPAAVSLPDPADLDSTVLPPAADDLAGHPADASPDAGIEPVISKPVSSQLDLPETPQASPPPAPPVVRKARAVRTKRVAAVEPAPLSFPVGVEDTPSEPGPSQSAHHEPVEPEVAAPEAVPVEAGSVEDLADEVLAGPASVPDPGLLAEIDRLRTEIEAVLSERDAIDRARLEERRRHSQVRAGMIATISRAATLLKPSERPSGCISVRRSVMDLRP